MDAHKLHVITRRRQKCLLPDEQYQKLSILCIQGVKNRS
jgi:hypothetical protein